MPDTRKHRGTHPEDAALFARRHEPTLRLAAAELCWLLDRGYALNSSLALTGNRHGLTQRQRLAVARCACSRAQLAHRRARESHPSALSGHELWIDGYNLLISIESALAGGVILLGRDGCCRDMASLHGSYREVSETTEAAKIIGSAVAGWGVPRCRWLLDRPVGNSARLKALLLGIAEEFGWTWQVDLEFSPDRILTSTTITVASSDSQVLDRCSAWCNAARYIIERNIPDAHLVDLGGTAEFCL